MSLIAKRPSFYALPDPAQEAQWHLRPVLPVARVSLHGTSRFSWTTAGTTESPSWMKNVLTRLSLKRPIGQRKSFVEQRKEQAQAYKAELDEENAARQRLETCLEMAASVDEPLQAKNPLLPATKAIAWPVQPTEPRRDSLADLLDMTSDYLDQPHRFESRPHVPTQHRRQDSVAAADAKTMPAGTWLDGLGFWLPTQSDGNQEPARPAPSAGEHRINEEADEGFQSLLPLAGKSFDLGSRNFELSPLFSEPDEHSSVSSSHDRTSLFGRALASKHSLLGKRSRSNDTLGSLLLRPSAKQGVLPEFVEGEMDLSTELAPLIEGEVTLRPSLGTSRAASRMSFTLINKVEVDTRSILEQRTCAYGSHPLTASGVGDLQNRGGHGLFGHMAPFSRQGATAVRKNGFFYTGVVDSKEKSAALVSFLQSHNVLNKNRHIIAKVSTKEILGIFSHVPFELTLTDKEQVISYLRLVEGFQSTTLDPQGIASIYGTSSNQQHKVATTSQQARKFGLFLTGIVDTKDKSAEAIRALQQKGVLDVAAQAVGQLEQSLIKECLAGCGITSEFTLDKVETYLQLVPKAHFSVSARPRNLLGKARTRSEKEPQKAAPRPEQQAHNAQAHAVKRSRRFRLFA